MNWCPASFEAHKGISSQVDGCYPGHDVRWDRMCHVSRRLFFATVGGLACCGGLGRGGIRAALLARCPVCSERHSVTMLKQVRGLAGYLSRWSLSMVLGTRCLVDAGLVASMLS